MAVAVGLVTRTLRECEQIIERGLTTFVEVGQALMEIRDGRLYREQGYSLFEDYCQQRWGWKHSHAYRLIESAQVATLLSPIGETPRTESQARELVPLLRQDEAAVVEVWRELKEQHGGRITAEKVREAVSARLERSQEQPAPAPAHVSFNSGNNEWYTPTEYIEAARRVMGKIDLDPASSDIANKTVKASTYFTAKDNGLERQWAGCVWMNPPYAAELIGKFTEKLVEHFIDGDVAEAIVLVNNATETNWFQGLLAHASTVCFVKQRVRFIDMAGNPTGAPLQGQAVLYLGDNPGSFAKEFAVCGIVLYGATGRNQEQAICQPSSRFQWT